MTYKECPVRRQVLNQDKRFAGTVFSRRKWSADEYSVSLQLKNGQEFEFSALKNFRNWHAEYRKSRRPVTGVLAVSSTCGKVPLIRCGAVEGVEASRAPQRCNGMLLKRDDDRRGERTAAGL